MTDDDGAGGWYPDPDGQPGRERWWDGSRWTDRTRAPGEDLIGHAARPPRRWSPAVLVAALAVTALAVTGIAVAAGHRPDRTPAAGSAATGTDRPGGTGSPDPGSPESPRGPESTDPGGPQIPGTPAQPVTCTGVAPPTAPPTATAPPPATRAPRVSDPDAGISYAGQGEPWQPWKDVWITPGLDTRFGGGYFIVTERDTPGGNYFATVLSGTVATRVADAPREEPRCIAERIAEDVRGAYYPEPNERRTLEARAIQVAGRPGYLIRYHLTFDVKGYAARGEQVGVLVLNVGRPQLAVLYISIPDTVRGFDYVIDQVFGSVHAP